jgi:hypothetical protein
LLALCAGFAGGRASGRLGSPVDDVAGGAPAVLRGDGARTAPDSVASSRAVGGRALSAGDPAPGAEARGCGAEFPPGTGARRLAAGSGGAVAFAPAGSTLASTPTTVPAAEVSPRPAAESPGACGTATGPAFIGTRLFAAAANVACSPAGPLACCGRMAASTPVKSCVEAGPPVRPGPGAAAEAGIDSSLGMSTGIVMVP